MKIDIAKPASPIRYPIPIIPARIKVLIINLLNPLISLKKLIVQYY